MLHISVLKKEISELIAAGEVIERPASVVKELVENSIDAGAKHITVEIKHGGTSYMRIVDDGCGMASDEVPLAFLRHATSKISQKEDLNQIFTLGFRGEALASVAAVAKVTVMTKRKENDFGTSFSIAGSVPGEVEQTGCPDGTTLMIRDLFYNVPVRQKFMKRDVTEANAVSQIVQKIALSHPEIAFRMIRDNRTEFRTDGNGSLYAAIYAILGKEFAHDLIPVEYVNELYRVSGFVGKPLYSRANRTFQNFFVNGRYVRSRQCSVALENAYQNLIMVGKFPTCVLMLEVPPLQIDVNIHPTKAEVRFSQEKAVMDFLYFAVKNALMENGLVYDFQMERVPQKDWTTPSEPQYVSQPLPETSETLDSVQPVETSVDTSASASASPLIATQTAFSVKQPQTDLKQPDVPTASISEDTDFTSIPELDTGKYQFLNHASFQARESSESDKFQQLTANTSVDEAEQVSESHSKIEVLGEVFQNYILAECGEENKLLIFDKHAAHERIIFEQLQSGASKQTSQMLLRPVETLLSMDEFSAVQENVARLEEMGFLFDCTKPPKLYTTAVPSFILDMNLNEVISEIAQNLMLGKQDPQLHSFQNMLHSIACKSAIRSGDRSDMQELQRLAQEVWENENIRHCPHGRPVMFVIRKYDLEKQFRRV
ncbi:MAG: DNA mismatch repair endonuclease MutL [Ruminococcus sp.]|nr:DNA mismatch repair endonuclease MutL [Ruminococcus sp.]